MWKRREKKSPPQTCTTLLTTDEHLRTACEPYKLEVKFHKEACYQLGMYFGQQLIQENHQFQLSHYTSQ